MASKVRSGLTSYYIPPSSNPHADAWRNRVPTSLDVSQPSSKVRMRDVGATGLDGKPVLTLSGLSGAHSRPYGKFGELSVTARMNTFAHPYWMPTLSARNVELKSSQVAGLRLGTRPDPYMRNVAMLDSYRPDMSDPVRGRWQYLFRHLPKLRRTILP